ncbi:hypothetical protein NAPIS_ORF00168 [Vairimorpha apis BRL 01]|uniref:Uncharacterized protein n=1 Tax=Vairimorpha apis BRL 01 TaxID=1037528 RepID=T0MGJ8_9MICR|nr:hypothetical protein NAPIS_ORF00168 [Vairimorpha apis BRL 01]
MLGKKETMLLTKVFYNALKTKNEFKYEGKGNFETDIFFINSEFFQKFSEDVLNCKNTIFHLYYKKNIFNHNEQKENENYLKSMITFLFLMYSKNTENAKHAFDFMFNNLPNGFLIPIEKLLYMNKDLITNLLNLKYKECFSEKLNVTTAKKLICIISLLQIQLVEINSVNQVQDYKKFKDDKLVLFIISVFEEFINQREILLYSENPENSIMAKTFELCLIYPYQELLYDKMILYVYPILYEYGKSYILKLKVNL